MRCRELAFVITLIASASAALGQNLISNGSFETPDAGGAFVNRGGGSLTGWLISGNLDHIGGFWAASEGVQSVDLNGSSAATISQNVATIAGHRYRLHYALSENFFGFADKTMDIAWEGNTVSSVTVVHDTARTTMDVRWSPQELFVTAHSDSATLAFISTTGAMNGSQGFASFYGPAIDDVQLEDVSGCGADFNGDGNLDPDDLGDYINCYFDVPACGGADFNGDGNVDPDDLGDYINAYFAGCA